MTAIDIHPAAECVRLMDAEELASLATSIEANGLRDAITLGRVNGAETVALVDGRNRLLACEMAGVPPRFETIDFKDDDAVKAFVRDKSEHRLLNKGQQAMRLALLYPEPEKGGRGKKAQHLKESLGFSQMRLSQARSVLAFSLELALAVRDGKEKLDAALKTIEAERIKLTSAEAKMKRLHACAPDLADLVSDERMGLDEALAAMSERMRARSVAIEQAQAAARRIGGEIKAALCAILTGVQVGAEIELSQEEIKGMIEDIKLMRSKIHG